MQAVIEEHTSAPSLATLPDGTTFTYSTDARGNAIIEACTTQNAHLTIPAELDGHAVVALAEQSLAHVNTAETITCPQSLRSIGPKAFSGCIKLHAVELNAGLISIEDEAFELCINLPEIELPATLENIGSCLAGQQAARSSHIMRIRIHHDNPYLFAREEVIYQSIDGGIQLVDGTRFNGDVLNVVPGTRGLGQRALYLNRFVRRIVLPEGVTFIGEEALRGCSNLAACDIPDTLEEIGRAAFSCTSLESIYLPAACVRVHERALDTGVVLDGVVQHFESTLRSISVHPHNPALCMCGDVLCKRIEGTNELRCILCPRHVENVALPKNVTSIAEGTFAGTTCIDCFSVCDGTIGDAASSMIAHSNCKRIDIELSRPLQGKTTISLELPAGALGAKVLENSYVNGRIDAALLLANYDAALAGEADELAQARHMTARLADPVHLAEEARSLFHETVASALTSIAAHFGARSYWQGLDQLTDAGLIDNANIANVISTLTALGDAASVSYLLDLKRTRFGEALWDYAL